MINPEAQSACKVLFFLSWSLDTTGQDRKLASTLTLHSQQAQKKKSF